MSKFKRNLIAGYAISLILLITSAVASYISIRNLLSGQQWVNHTLEVIIKLDDLTTGLKDAETNQRGFLLTKDNEYLEPYNSSVLLVRQLITDVKLLTSDNPDQQVTVQELTASVNRRINYLQNILDSKKGGKDPTIKELKGGKATMDESLQIIKEMKTREQNLLLKRTDILNRSSSSTPTLIVIAALLSLLVTIISFLRVTKDYTIRTELQKALEIKNVETQRRIDILQDIAQKISTGNYTTRLDDESEDALGTLSFSLNKMAESLETAFTELSAKEWLQAGIAKLNEIMIGEKDLQSLCYNSIEFLSSYTESPIGALYINDNMESLTLTGSYGLDEAKRKKQFLLGEGIPGQCGLSGKEISMQNSNDTDYVINAASGKINPSYISAFPIFYEKRVIGVIELAKLQPFNQVSHDFIKASSFNLGIAINSVKEQQRMLELLNETQTQAEELQSQHSELENINTELEAQSQKLQASEEELRVQQEELQQANQELEERSAILEEKNELILKRNLDIQTKAEELEQSTKYKSEFLANMSHELRTPLNSILLLSRLLSENHAGNLDSDQIEYATVIQQSGKGLLTLIDEILDLSKIESGKMELDFLDIKVSHVADDIKSLFEPIAKEKGLEFKIELKDEVDTIETDRLRVEQILRNLISNALKFTKKGSVILSVSQTDKKVLFSVTDTGIGIPTDKLQTVFEAFKQADGSTSRQYGGTGLGLSISRELAKLLGGEITVTSAINKGSEFTLHLPLHKGAIIQVEKENSIVRDLKPIQAQSLTVISGNKYLSKVIPLAIPDDRHQINKDDKVILIIEDDVAFARSLLDYTRQKGYKGLIAVRGDEGLELAKSFKPTGILLDLQLPVKSGWEVIDSLKNDPETRSIPVHMMSSHEVKSESLRKGAVDFISKPVAFEKLSGMFAQIEKALSSYPRKVLIVEENAKHAQALAYFLEDYNINAKIKNSVKAGITALNEKGADCIILDMGMPMQGSYEELEDVKKTPGLEHLPIIVFTGKNLSNTEEMQIKKYADSIIVKTAHSYERILDEVSLFLHIVEENKKSPSEGRYKKMGQLNEVLQGKNILVADDDVRNIFSITKSLEQYHVNVISAINGKEALLQLESLKKVDLILMDMMMPEMDGYESIQKIRLNPANKNVPIIAVTAKAMMGDREKCLAAGASDYITKPIDMDQLVSLLRVWLYQ